MRWSLSRRSWLQAAGVSCRSRRVGACAAASGQAANPHDGHVLGHAGHALGIVGEVDTSTSSTRDAYLPSFNFSHLPETERARFYRETPRPDGSLLREYEIFAVDREIEIAPGVKFRGVDLQRSGARSHDSRDRRRSRPRALRQSGLAPAHDSLPRLASARTWTGRSPQHQVVPGENFRLRVRSRSVRPAPVSLPRGAAEAAHSQGALRHVHHRPERTPTTRRATSS